MGNSHCSIYTTGSKEDVYTPNSPGTSAARTVSNNIEPKRSNNIGPLTNTNCDEILRKYSDWNPPNLSNQTYQISQAVLENRIGRSQSYTQLPSINPCNYTETIGGFSFATNSFYDPCSGYVMDSNMNQQLEQSPKPKPCCSDDFAFKYGHTLTRPMWFQGNVAYGPFQRVSLRSCIDFQRSENGPQPNPTNPFDDSTLQNGNYQHAGPNPFLDNIDYNNVMNNPFLAQGSGLNAFLPQGKTDWKEIPLLPSSSRTHAYIPSPGSQPEPGTQTELRKTGSGKVMTSYVDIVIEREAGSASAGKNNPEVGILHPQHHVQTSQIQTQTEDAENNYVSNQAPKGLPGKLQPVATSTIGTQYEYDGEHSGLSGIPGGNNLPFFGSQIQVPKNNLQEPASKPDTPQKKTSKSTIQRKPNDFAGNIPGTDDGLNNYVKKDMQLPAHKAVPSSRGEFGPNPAQSQQGETSPTIGRKAADAPKEIPADQLTTTKPESVKPKPDVGSRPEGFVRTAHPQHPGQTIPINTQTEPGQNKDVPNQARREFPGKGQPVPTSTIGADYGYDSGHSGLSGGKNLPSSGSRAPVSTNNLQEPLSNPDSPQIKMSKPDNQRKQNDFAGNLPSSDDGPRNNLKNEVLIPAEKPVPSSKSKFGPSPQSMQGETSPTIGRKVVDGPNMELPASQRTKNPRTADPAVSGPESSKKGPAGTVHSQPPVQTSQIHPEGEDDGHKIVLNQPPREPTGKGKPVPTSTIGTQYEHDLGHYDIPRDSESANNLPNPMSKPGAPLAPQKKTSKPTIQRKQNDFGGNFPGFDDGLSNYVKNELLIPAQKAVPSSKGESGPNSAQSGETSPTVGKNGPKELTGEQPPTTKPKTTKPNRVDSEPRPKPSNEGAVGTVQPQPPLVQKGQIQSKTEAAENKGASNQPSKQFPGKGLPVRTSTIGTDYEPDTGLNLPPPGIQEPISTKILEEPAPKQGPPRKKTSKSTNQRKQNDSTGNLPTFDDGLSNYVKNEVLIPAQKAVPSSKGESGPNPAQSQKGETSPTIGKSIAEGPKELPAAQKTKTKPKTPKRASRPEPQNEGVVGIVNPQPQPVQMHQIRPQTEDAETKGVSSQPTREFPGKAQPVATSSIGTDYEDDAGHSGLPRGNNLPPSGRQEPFLTKNQQGSVLKPDAPQKKTSKPTNQRKQNDFAGNLPGFDDGLSNYVKNEVLIPAQKAVKVKSVPTPSQSQQGETNPTTGRKVSNGPKEFPANQQKSTKPKPAKPKRVDDDFRPESSNDFVKTRPKPGIAEWMRPSQNLEYVPFYNEGYRGNNIPSNPTKKPKEGQQKISSNPSFPQSKNRNPQRMTGGPGNFGSQGNPVPGNQMYREQPSIWKQSVPFRDEDRSRSPYKVTANGGTPKRLSVSACPSTALNLEGPRRKSGPNCDVIFSVGRPLSSYRKTLKGEVETKVGYPSKPAKNCTPTAPENRRDGYYTHFVQKRQGPARPSENEIPRTCARKTQSTPTHPNRGSGSNSAGSRGGNRFPNLNYPNQRNTNSNICPPRYVQRGMFTDDSDTGRFLSNLSDRQPKPNNRSCLSPSQMREETARQFNRLRIKPIKTNNSRQPSREQQQWIEICDDPDEYVRAWQYAQQRQQQQPQAYYANSYQPEFNKFAQQTSYEDQNRRGSASTQPSKSNLKKPSEGFICGVNAKKKRTVQFSAELPHHEQCQDGSLTNVSFRNFGRKSRRAHQRNTSSPELFNENFPENHTPYQPDFALSIPCRVPESYFLLKSEFDSYLERFASAIRKSHEAELANLSRRPPLVSPRPYGSDTNVERGPTNRRDAACDAGPLNSSAQACPTTPAANSGPICDTSRSSRIPECQRRCYDPCNPYRVYSVDQLTSTTFPGSLNQQRSAKEKEVDTIDMDELERAGLLAIARPTSRNRFIYSPSQHSSTSSISRDPDDLDYFFQEPPATISERSLFDVLANLDDGSASDPNDNESCQNSCQDMQENVDEYSETDENPGEDLKYWSELEYEADSEELNDLIDPLVFPITYESTSSQHDEAAIDAYERSEFCEMSDDIESANDYEMDDQLDALLHECSQIVSSENNPLFEESAQEHQSAVQSWLASTLTTPTDPMSILDLDCINPDFRLEDPKPTPNTQQQPAAIQINTLPPGLASQSVESIEEYFESNPTFVVKFNEERPVLVSSLRKPCAGEDSDSSTGISRARSHDKNVRFAPTLQTQIFIDDDFPPENMESSSESEFNPADSPSELMKMSQDQNQDSCPRANRTLSMTCFSTSSSGSAVYYASMFRNSHIISPNSDVASTPKQSESSTLHKSLSDTMINSSASTSSVWNGNDLMVNTNLSLDSVAGKLKKDGEAEEKLEKLLQNLPDPRTFSDD